MKRSVAGVFECERKKCISGAHNTLELRATRANEPSCRSRRRSSSNLPLWPTISRVRFPFSSHVTRACRLSRDRSATEKSSRTTFTIQVSITARVRSTCRLRFAPRLVIGSLPLDIRKRWYLFRFCSYPGPKFVCFVDIPIEMETKEGKFNFSSYLLDSVGFCCFAAFRREMN